MMYELFYLVGASKEAELDKIKSEAEEIVTKSGGQFSEKTTLEKRRLSYAVKHESHGIYIARRFELEKNENIKDIIAKLNLNASILRFIISKAAELPDLKTKEERMSEALVHEAPRMKREEKPIRNITQGEEKIKKEVSSEKEEKIKEEDIDKKLEEILNI
jgi:ribosomal protein S6